MSRTRWYGFSNGIAVPVLDDHVATSVPIPSAKRPGAAEHIAATVCASVAAPRVKTGTIAVPSRSVGVQAAASVSGSERVVAAGLRRPQVRVPERDELLVPRSMCSASEMPSKGTVMP